MKNWTLQRCGLALVLASFPFLGGCDQEQANSATVTDIAASQPASDSTSPAADSAATNASVIDTNQPAPDPMDQQLANAPGKIISTPETASTNANSNPQLSDVVKLVQAGVGETVLMAYVTNSAQPFNISSDDVIYLNDLGMPETVVTAMLQLDQRFKPGSAPAAAPTTAQSQAAYATPLAAPPAPEPDQNVMAAAEAVTPPSVDVEAAEQAPNASYSYFYDSLSPYGNWVDIQGYGPCWQPTTVVANPGWQPYCDRGHWAYTDCGWCWVSDYSWGWAPFHYGRWFRHSHFGWCWAPDTVWSPAWVSWRYSDAHCGWAALPPSACYRPGFGFTYYGRAVGFNFGFGLGADCFVFVPFGHFRDRSPGHFRLPHREITKIYNTTVVNTQIIRGNNNTLINRGVPVDRIAAATHTEIRPIHIRTDVGAPGAAQLGRDGRSLSVYRPALPLPKPSGNPRLAGEGVKPNPEFNLRERVNRAATAGNGQPQPRQSFNPASPLMPARRPIISPENPPSENRNFQPGNGNQLSPVSRGPDRSSPIHSQNPDQNPPNNFRRGPGLQPQNPTQPTAPTMDNRRPFVPATPQPNQPVIQPQNPPPVFNRPGNDFRRNGADQQPQQRQFFQGNSQAPRDQTEPRAFQSPRQEQQQPQRDFNPGFRSDPVIRSQPQVRSDPPVRSEPAQSRSFEQRSEPQVRSSAPQYSAPARQENNNQGGGNGNWNGNFGGGNGNGNGNGNGRGNH